MVKELDRILLASVEREIFRGAEAIVYIGNLWGLKVVVKYRTPKRYRNPVLDASLRRKRIKRECKAMVEARKAGLRVPFILDVYDFQITTEFIPGTKLHTYLMEGGSTSILEDIGKYVGKLHNAGLTHGDLTVHNIIISDGKPYFIDFGLSEFTYDLEDFATDLFVLRCSLRASIGLEGLKLFNLFLKGYSNEVGRLFKLVNLKLTEIEYRRRHYGD